MTDEAAAVDATATAVEALARRDVSTAATAVATAAEATCARNTTSESDNQSSN
jgi:hypothetical protein